jgi:hypothetical protein
MKPGIMVHFNGGGSVLLQGKAMQNFPEERKSSIKLRQDGDNPSYKWR